MNLLHWLLIKVSEEASEVSQAACKAAEFGLSSKNPNTGTYSDTKIKQENIDLQAMFLAIDQVTESSELSDDFEPQGTVIHEEMDRKIQRVIFYAHDAIDRGVLHPEPQEWEYINRVKSRWAGKFDHMNYDGTLKEKVSV